MFNRSLRLAAAAACLCLAPLAASADASGHVVVTPDDVAMGPPNPMGIRMQVLYGDPTAAGPYSVRVFFPAGFKVPPHTHPDMWRTSYVVSGSMRFGVGEVWDDAAMTEFPAGTFFTEPPTLAHFAEVGPEGVTAIVTAAGPTGMIPIE